MFETNNDNNIFICEQLLKWHRKSEDTKLHKIQQNEIKKNVILGVKLLETLNEYSHNFNAYIQALQKQEDEIMEGVIKGFKIGVNIIKSSKDIINNPQASDVDINLQKLLMKNSISLMEKDIHDMQILQKMNEIPYITFNQMMKMCKDACDENANDDKFNMFVKELVKYFIQKVKSIATFSEEVEFLATAENIYDGRYQEIKSREEEEHVTNYLNKLDSLNNRMKIAFALVKMNNTLLLKAV